VSKPSELIRVVDLSKVNELRFPRRGTSCAVLTKDRKILLQQRGEDWRTFPGCLSTFGGGLEEGEAPMDALVREMKEELGAKVKPADVVRFGAITEAITDHTELVYVYFWSDTRGTITGCYEGEARFYETVKDAIAHPKVMDYVPWLLNECQKRGLIG
jgi:8-oxo-dGTP diphosphatase